MPGLAWTLNWTGESIMRATATLLVLTFCLAPAGRAFAAGMGPASNPSPLPSGAEPWTEQKATAADGAAADQFGRAVAIQGDIAIIGSPNATVDGRRAQGAAYMYARSAGTWSEVQKLVASDGAAADVFGIAVALDGDTAIVGAYSAEGYRGAVYVYTFADGIWSEAQRLIADDRAEFDQFGWAVALDGDVLLVGAQGAAIDGNNGQGAVYAFERDGGSWGQVDKFTSADGAAADGFGWAVALDGDSAVVGSGFVTVGGNLLQGAAYAFERSGTNWTQAQTLLASNGAAFDSFGLSVAISGDTLLVGASGAATDGDPFSNQGVAYEFTRSGDTWSEGRQLAGSDSESADGFGTWVALEGDAALVGAVGANVGGNEYQGAAYLFERTAGDWKEARKFTSSDGAENDQYGFALALSGDRVLVGAYNATVDADIGEGAAYFHEKPAPDLIFADGFDAVAQ